MKDDNRREFLRKAGLGLLAVPLLAGSAAAQSGAAANGEDSVATDRFISKGSADLGGNFAVDPDWEADNQELISSFVMPCHFSIEKAGEILKQDRRVLNSRVYSTDEAGIEAASHTGAVPVAQWLLGNGAPYTLHCSVMMGHVPAARGFFELDREQARRPGAHGIPLMFHAAISGSIEMAELLEEYGGGQDYSWALCGAAGWIWPEMTEWMLARGADVNYVSQERTPLDWAERPSDNDAVISILRAHGAKHAGELE
jgi:hypothetical protein